MQQQQMAPGQQPMAPAQQPPAVIYQDNQPSTKQRVVYRMPSWVLFVRVGQICAGLIVIALSAILIRGALVTSLAFALVCGFFNLFVVPYIIVSERRSSAHRFYNVYAVMSLDFVMSVLWLASMGANAKTRSEFNYTVNVYGCYDDGSSIDSTTCIVGRSLVEKRALVANKAGLAYISIIAGLSGVECLLFVAALIYLARQWKKSRPEKIAGPVGGTAIPAAHIQQPQPNAVNVQQPLQPQYAMAPQPQLQPQSHPQVHPQPQSYPQPQQYQQNFAPSPVSATAYTPPPSKPVQSYQPVHTPGPEGAANTGFQSELPGMEPKRGHEMYAQQQGQYAVPSQQQAYNTPPQYQQQHQPGGN